MQWCGTSASFGIDTLTRCLFMKISPTKDSVLEIAKPAHRTARTTNEAATSDASAASKPNALPSQTNTSSSVVIADTLTKQDKALLTHATGGVVLKGADGMHLINPLAVQIALDRHHGLLSGEIDTKYIDRLAQSQKLTLQNTIPSAVLDRALAFVARSHDAH